LQLYFSPMLAQFTLREVDFENTELEDLGDAVVRVHGSLHLGRAISEFNIRAHFTRRRPAIQPPMNADKRR
jgi:hypothetical protein